MPSAKVLGEKQAVVSELTDRLKASVAAVLVDYSGISVANDTELRRRTREENVTYTVVKNTLLRRAIDNVGYKELDPLLNGTTSIATSTDDPLAPARVMCEYADKLQDHFTVKGGFMDGKVISVDEINALAKIPPLPILRAQALGTMLAPITSLAVVLKAITDQKSGGTAEAAE